MPTAWAAMPGRERSKVFMAMAKPSPSAPRRFDAGTRTSSNTSSAVGEPRIPILCSVRATPNPGRLASTTKHERRRWRLASSPVAAKTITRSATDPWLMKRLLPEMT